MKNVAKWVVVGVPVFVLAFLLTYNFLSDTDGSTRLSWTVPTEYENGDPIDYVAGYDLFCWNGANQDDKTIHVGDPAITSYVIDDIAPGTYQCAVAAIDSAGRRSALSNIVAKTVP